MRILQFLPGISQRSGGPIRSTLATIRAVHAFAPRVRTDLVATDLNLEGPWHQEVVSKLPGGAKLMVFQQCGKHTHNVSMSLLRWLYGSVESYDLVVVRSLFHPLSSAVGLVAAVHGGRPVVLTPHGSLSLYTRTHGHRWLKSLYMKLIDRRLIERCALVQVTSEFEAREAKDVVPTERLRIVPHPFEPEFQCDGGLRDDSMFVFLSRLHPMKGLETLLRAFARLRGVRGRARLSLAGSGDDAYISELKALCRSLKIESWVRFEGFVDGADKYRLLSKALCFVLPSYRENYSIAAVEAMSVGTPVIISDNVGIASLVMQAHAGLVVPADVRPVSNAMRRLIDNPENARQMGEAGREVVRSELSPRKVGEQVMGVYKEACDGRH